ncbi:D-isomer specific 2-hydroxyacid dehydrogenase [Xylariaceae sp. FL1272]|nr:D-isomer specific 2-hydroxyacid dehydrogenase [Xylariaceae sp. FL1272]
MTTPIAPRAGGLHKVVCLDAVLCPVPKFDFPHEYVEYENTIGEDLIIERVKDATIVITTRAWMSARTISHCPKLELIALMAIGFDIIDMEACRERKITVCNSPAASAESVAEHAFALYFAAKRKIVELHHMILEGHEWPEKKNGFFRYAHVPRVSRHETLGIVGYGGLGKILESIGKALGMEVIIAERKGISESATRPGRTPFDQVLRTCTVLMLGCPLDEETRNMIAEPELESMRRDSIVVNVARGGVMNEAALVKALNMGWISSAATDVFAIEPATSTSTPLVTDCPANLTLSPHVAWYADTSFETLQLLIKETLECYVIGKPRHMVKGSWSVYSEISGSKANELSSATVVEVTM